MPYFVIRDSKTSVEAIGQVTTKHGAYYASWAGPAQAAKAIWAAAVGSTNTGMISSTWRHSEKMLKPVASAIAVKLPNSNYVHYVLRSGDPSFVLVTDPKMAQIREFSGWRITPYGNEETTAPYRAIQALLPEWQFPTWEGNTTTTLQVANWYASQPQFQAKLARKLVNALNQFTKVPVLPEWGPKLLERLPYDAHEPTFCFGDAVAALKLNPEYDWATWISGLLRTRSITIPNPDGD